MKAFRDVGWLTSRSRGVSENRQVRIVRPAASARFGGAGFGRRPRGAGRNRRRHQPAPFGSGKRNGRHRPRRVPAYGVPHAAFINAAFAYSKPSEPIGSTLRAGPGTRRSRWTTCMREVAYHMADFLGKSGQYQKAWSNTPNCSPAWRGSSSTYRTQTELHPCLNPDPAIGYPIGNAIADAALAQGLNGVIYPSVRHAGGTCIAALTAARGAICRSRRLSIGSSGLGRPRADDYARVRGAFENFAPN